MRLFFAAFPDGESRREISIAVRTLGPSAASAQLPPDHYHMTVLFLGEVPASEIHSVRAIGKAQRTGYIAMQFDRWEYWAQARVLVAATTQAPQPLADLRAGLAAGLARRGIAFDDTPLRPHITVARKVAQAPVLQALSKITWTVRAFSLVESVTAPLGSVYTVVDTWPLLDTTPRS